MVKEIDKSDWIFLFLCLLVGIVAEESFFRDQIGVSYFVFIVVFYGVFFWRFRSFSFSHQRLGYLVLISIWILAAGYYLYDTVPFYVLNILVIPSLALFHLVLTTAPKKLAWNNLYFIYYAALRLIDGLRYNAFFAKYTAKLFKRKDNEKHHDVWKKVLLGIAFSIPFLIVVLNLLISADTQFERLLSGISDLLSFRVDYVFRLMVILFFTLSFFGFLQALIQKSRHMVQREEVLKPINMDGIIALTFLILLDLVYILFVAVQFKYFFSGTLDDGFTYAQYARRGFFELLFVTLINLTVTTGIIQFTKNIQGSMKKLLQVGLSILVLSSGVMLVSAFMRMMMYEDAYGFTFLRVLVHSFMIFLLVIFFYTLVKIWLERLSLSHFYFIAALIYYSGINIVNLDRIVVDLNIDRFEATGKIDIHYLNQLSSTGVLGLIDLFEKNPDVPGLEDLLRQRKVEREFIGSDSWQSKNLTRSKAYEKLGKLDL